MFDLVTETLKSQRNSGICLCKIISAEKEYWYYELVGNPILLRLLKGTKKAFSHSMPNLEVKNGDFIILKGIDCRKKI